MSFLLDTNVLSEVRRAQPSSPLRVWMENIHGSQLYISVLVLGEIRWGIELLRCRDRVQAAVIGTWLESVESSFADQALPITREVADAWGRLNVPNRFPVADGLMLATAQVHGLTFATRNVADVVRFGVPIVNPFDP